MSETQWPGVTVVICTYNRLAEIIQTIDALFEHLRYPNLHWHIADDGTQSINHEDIGNIKGVSWMASNYLAHDPSGGYVEFIRYYILYLYSFLGYHREGIVKEDKVTSTITDRQGWGANVNKALRAVQTDYVYFTEDDYVLLRDLDLRPYVALLETVPTLGMLRFGIIGHDGIHARLCEEDISDWLPDYQENDSNRGYTGSGKIGYWEIMPADSGGRFGFYAYSNRPHLKRRAFHEAYGYYPTGLGLAETEHAMNHLIRDPASPYCPIGVPANWSLWHYDHIGVSRQGTVEDVHR